MCRVQKYKIRVKNKFYNNLFLNRKKFLCKIIFFYWNCTLIYLRRNFFFFFSERKNEINYAIDRLIQVFRWCSSLSSRQWRRSYRLACSSCLLLWYLPSLDSNFIRVLCTRHVTALKTLVRIFSSCIIVNSPHNT